MKILADASLPNIKTLFDSTFKLTLYNTQEDVSRLINDQDILFCRSTLKITAELLTNCAIQCVATASSGTDHIDTDYLQQQGIFLLDAKGTNARSVADYVVSTLAWLVNSGKPLGKKIGIIGVGAVGSQIIARLRPLNVNMICFDPLKAAQDKSFSSCSFEELTTCDIVCIHANLHTSTPFPSRHLLDASFFSRLKTNMIIINAARGDIVNEQDLLNAKHDITYCTDVYTHEPEIDTNIIDYATLCTPHIAGHSIEAKETAVMQIAQRLHEHYKKDMPLIRLSPSKHEQTLLSRLNWVDAALSLYNPYPETIGLKQAIDKKQAFLTLRKAHTIRHDFIFYDTKQLDKPTRLLLGAT